RAACRWWPAPCGRRRGAAWRAARRRRARRPRRARRDRPAPRRRASSSGTRARRRRRGTGFRSASIYTDPFMATAHATARPMTAEERVNQRNAVLAGFLGWTLDAFDFFILTLVIDDVARSFGRTRPDIAFALTVALATRPIGAVIFGIMADHLGRRLPLMLNVIFYAIISVLSGLAPNYMTFLALRMLFGIGMGGEWGVGASLALESASPRLRGLLSGLLQEGYALGNLLSALAFRLVYPMFESMYPHNGWRLMFFLGGLPALLSLFIRARGKESEAWHEHKTDWAT